MRRGISAVRATWGLPRVWHFCPLASGLGKVGRPQQGLQVLEEGFASVLKTAEQASGPNLHHVKGELLLVQNPSDVAQAKRCFRTAIEIARQQRARSPGLPATTSLARLLVHQRCRDEAHAMLTEICGWFTEGPDTAGLKDAKALLDEFNS